MQLYKEQRWTEYPEEEWGEWRSGTNLPVGSEDPSGGDGRLVFLSGPLWEILQTPVNPLVVEIQAKHKLAKMEKLCNS